MINLWWFRSTQGYETRNEALDRVYVHYTGKRAPSNHIKPKWWWRFLKAITVHIKKLLIVVFLFLTWFIPQIPDWLTVLNK